MAQSSVLLSGTQEMEESDKSSKSWNEFVIQTLINNSNRTVGISEVRVDSGYVWANEGPSQETSAASLNTQTISAMSTFKKFNPYGTRGTATGTSGYFRIRDVKTNRTVCKVDWACPYASGWSNSYRVYESDPDWTVNVKPSPVQQRGGFKVEMTFTYSPYQG